MLETLYATEGRQGNLQRNNGHANIATKYPSPGAEIFVMNIIPIQQHISHITE